MSVRRKSVLISVAHSSVAPGAVNVMHTANEHLISLRASIAAFRTLTGTCSVELFDCGPLTAREYSAAKVDRVNGCRPDLAVEIHLNAGGGRYSEVIHHRSSAVGAAAASAIAGALADGLRPRFSTAELETRGARPNSIEKDKHMFFFLERTVVSAVIVEGLFIDRESHVRWLLGADGGAAGAEVYGTIVAHGIKRWLGVAA